MPAEPKWRREALDKLHGHAKALKNDPHLGAVVRRTGPIALNTHPRAFHSLVRAIVSQQISVKAAQTIHGRLLGLVGGERGLSPAAVADLHEDDLRAAGLSGQKTRYLYALSEHALDGRLPVNKLHRMSDEAVTGALVDVPGIGVWTAQMFLMFYLAREDVWPVGDLGLREALARLHGTERPTEKAAQPLGDRWAGRRSVATWYLWRSLEGSSNDGGIW